MIRYEPNYYGDEMREENQGAYVEYDKASLLLEKAYACVISSFEVKRKDSHDNTVRQCQYCKRWLYRDDHKSDCIVLVAQSFISNIKEMK